jgi:hypothetical protein
LYPGVVDSAVSERAVCNDAAVFHIVESAGDFCLAFLVYSRSFYVGVVDSAVFKIAADEYVAISPPGESAVGTVSDFAFHPGLRKKPIKW